MVLMKLCVRYTVFTIMFIYIIFGNWLEGSDVEEHLYSIHQGQTWNPINLSTPIVDLRVDLFHLESCPVEDACVDYCSRDAGCVSVVFNR